MSGFDGMFSHMMLLLPNKMRLTLRISFLWRVFMLTNWNLVFCKNSAQLALTRPLGWTFFSVSHSVEVMESQNKKCVNIYKTNLFKNVNEYLWNIWSSISRTLWPTMSEVIPALDAFWVVPFDMQRRNSYNPPLKIHIYVKTIPVVSISETFHIWP